MLFNTIVDIIARRLGNRTGLNTAITAECDLQQATILELNGRIVPWFLETELSQTTTTSGERRVSLPLDFCREKDDGGLFYYNASSEDQPWTKLKKDDYDYLVEKFQDEEGAPSHYSISARYFRIFPMPDAGYVLRQIYFAREPAPSTLGPSVENAWTKYAPDLLIAVVSEVMAGRYLQNQDLATLLASDVQRAWDRIVVDTEAREHTNRSYTMGDL